jgi:hypothetical protein
MSVETIVAEVQNEFRAKKPRRFAAGVLIGLIDLLRAIGIPRPDVRSYEDLIRAFPREGTVAGGGTANTLILRTSADTTTSLRPFYNKAEKFFRVQQKRYDYPNCAPHATQSWKDYTHWIDELCTFTIEQLQEIRSTVVEFVLAELPSHQFVPGRDGRREAVFRKLLEEFDFGARPGERTGAAFQGVAFGFIRAENPHLQVEVDKVRAGSRRLQRVGDIDAWDGKRLAATVEVKHLVVNMKTVQDIEAFTQEANVRDAIGIVIGKSFTDEARVALEGRGIRTLSREDLIRLVDLWDSAKQKIAIESFLYYAARVEKNAALTGRIEAFLSHQGDDSASEAGG